MRAAKLTVWFLSFIIVINLGLSLLTKASSIDNIIGFVIIIAIVYLTVKTKFFTKIKLIKKDEK